MHIYIYTYTYTHCAYGKRARSILGPVGKSSMQSSLRLLGLCKQLRCYLHSLICWSLSASELIVSKLQSLHATRCTQI